MMKKWVMIGGAVVLALGVQQMRINSKERKIANKNLEITRLSNELSAVIDANESQNKTISRLREANEQCALDKAVNLENSKLELASQSGRIRSIREKYEKLKTSQVAGKCAQFRVDPDVFDLVQEARSDQD